MLHTTSKSSQGKVDLLGIGTEKFVVLCRTPCQRAHHCAQCRCTELMVTPVTSQFNFDARWIEDEPIPHPTSSTLLARLNFGLGGQSFGQMLLLRPTGFRRYFIRRKLIVGPKAMMNMAPPQQTIKHRRQIVVTANILFSAPSSRQSSIIFLSFDLEMNSSRSLINRNNAASIEMPGPNANARHGRAALRRRNRSRMNSTVGDDILPYSDNTPDESAKQSALEADCSRTRFDNPRPAGMNGPRADLIDRQTGVR